jgi:inorganic pyrophosphatase
MPDFVTLPAWSAKDHVHVVVETPRGAGAKLKYDLRLGAFTLSKPMMLGLAYPYDFGFIPSTHAEDGDPLDAMVIHDAATATGVVVRCRAVGVLKVAQRENKGPRVRNDRIMAIPEEDQRQEEVKDARDFSREMQQELEKFFVASVALKKRELEFLGWGGPSEARKLIRKAEASYRERQAE